MAKNLEFFLVALPGLEDLVARELSEWFPDIESKTEHGGVTVSVPMNIGLAMNLCLKTPTRVLMRVDRFRCRDFPKLYNKVLHFDWSDWLEPDSELDVEVATRLSRVKIKSRIVDTVLDAWMDRARENAVTFKRGKKATLFVRFHEDECTLSLDTSGERLHKRGLREFVGEAPLRETIAAALIQWVGELDPEAKDVEVIDPMMGAGTFLLEAAVRDRLVDRREFAFGAFPANSLNEPKPPKGRPQLARLTGFEADAKTLKAAETNLAKARVGVPMNLEKQDFFKAGPLPAALGSRWVFCNPPYGERLKVKEPLADLYAKLFAQIENVAKPDRVCVLLPSKSVKGKFHLPPRWKVLGKRPLLNGGLPVVAFVFGPKSP